MRDTFQAARSVEIYCSNPEYLHTHTFHICVQGFCKLTQLWIWSSQRKERYARHKCALYNTKTT